jgi:hypothetical protein
MRTKQCWIVRLKLFDGIGAFAKVHEIDPCLAIEFFTQFFEIWKLFDTGCAPSRPEVDDGRSFNGCWLVGKICKSLI